jgi:amino acid adenylation domain-containing protein
MRGDTNSICTRFAESAVLHSTRFAVSAPAGQWTYTELDRCSDAVAEQILGLLGQGAEPLALLMDHDGPLIAAILGTLKAGRIYLVLDPGHPVEQLAPMLAASGASLLLTDSSNSVLASSLASDRLQVQQPAERLSAHFPLTTLPVTSAEAAAWLMFTSGSTGTPKGVWQNHQGLVAEAEAYAELIGLVPDDRVSLLASCGLAASGATLFATLLSGATLCLFHLRSQGVKRLADWLARERITVFHSVPTIFRHLARAAEGGNSFASLRLIRLGGEPVLAADVEIFRRQCPDQCRFVQSFSSTETGIISTFTMDKRTSLETARVSAGHPISGVEVFLVDEDGRPVKHGDEGRIVVRSARLRQGYWREPDATAQKFRADETRPHLRTFSSNDLGRFLPDGSLEHLGRTDQLVKIRGQRVDLGAVEAALLATGLAKEAAVIAPEDPAGERRLAAYLVPSGGAAASSKEFRHKLRSQLPEHMIPGDFVALENLPHTPGGKVDRRALLSSSPFGSRVSLGRGHRPRNVIDTRLTRIWESTLQVSPVARTDDFFELGGTSLQSADVLLRIQDLFGVSLPPSTLVEHSTIERLAALLENHSLIRSSGPLVKLRDGDGGRPLFLIHSGQGDVASYGLLARRLKDRPVYGLQCVALQGECWPLTSVPAMARRYLPEILAANTTGPYLLAGACMGGLVAFELAQMLVRQGKEVGLLGLLDSHFPVASSPHLKWRRRAYVSLRAPLHEGWRMLRWRVIRALGLGRKSSLLPAYRRFVANINSRANRSYRPASYPGEITLFITAGTKFTCEDPRLMMRSLAKTTRVISISGDRAGLFVKPAVDELAEKLQAAMADSVRQE